MIRQDMVRYASYDEQAVRVVRDVLGRDLLVGPHAEAFLNPCGDDIEDPERPAFGQTMGHEVIAPYMIFNINAPAGA
jgi:hypothetical protein